MKSTKFWSRFKRLPPGVLLVFGFAFVIFLGAVLLLLPAMQNPNTDVSFVNSLFTSTSAVCVTGLIAVDTADTFSVAGRTIVALLIQIGGLGVTSVGVGLILLARKRIGLKSRMLVKEALNLESFRGAVVLVRAILIMTLCFETLGTALSYLSFSKYYAPLDALGISLFHSIAAFNNSGFDILGGLTNLIPYQGDVLLNLTTCGLIFFGGIGFLVILDVMKKRRFRTLTLHSKIVITTSVVLIVLGTLLLKLTENITWLGALFQSVSARTAGFSTYAIGSFTGAGLFTLTILMFIGASPGSTGGGIKTSTMFTLLMSVRGIVSNRRPGAFKRTIAHEVVEKAFTILLLSAFVVCIATFALCVLEPSCTFQQVLFEVVSAFGTVGLSTGITPALSDAAKLVLVLVMFIGRLGPLTIVLLGAGNNEPGARYSEEAVTVG
ncbi:MAG: potassium transporter TrkG [Clostridia bacterium]